MTRASFLACLCGLSRNKLEQASGLRGSGCEVFSVNPNANEVESTRCYPDLGSIPGPIDRIVIATHPRNARDIVRQCIERRVRQV